MSDLLREAMGEISLDDIRVEPDGRVTIANQDVAKRISDLKTSATAALRSNNTRCTVTNRGCS